MGWLEIAYYIVVIALAVYSFVGGSKQNQPNALTLDEIKPPVAEEGKTIPVLFGTRDVHGANVVWYGNLRTTPVQVSSGK